MTFDIAAALTHGLHGAGAAGIVLSLTRLAIGTFFALSGYNKLMNKERHKRFYQTMVDDKVPKPSFMQYWVPMNELMFGTFLALGWLSAFSATVLAIICVVACICEARKRVAEYNPINIADTVDDYLYLPEVLYLALLAIVVFVGHGTIALDTILFPLTN